MLAAAAPLAAATAAAATAADGGGGGDIYTALTYDELTCAKNEYLAVARALVIRIALGWDAVNRLTPGLLLNLAADFPDTNIGDCTLSLWGAPTCTRT